MIPVEVKDFRGLVRWLATAKHNGAYYPMAQKVGVSAGLVYQWKDGLVKRPSDDSIERICQEYNLEFWEVMALTRPKRRRPVISGGSDAVLQVLEKTGDIMSSIFRKVYHLEWSLFPQPQFAPAA